MKRGAVHSEQRKKKTVEAFVISWLSAALD